MSSRQAAVPDSCQSKPVERSRLPTGQASRWQPHRRSKTLSAAIGEPKKRHDLPEQSKETPMKLAIALTAALAALPAAAQIEYQKNLIQGTAWTHWVEIDEFDGRKTSIIFTRPKHEQENDDLLHWLLFSCPYYSGQLTRMAIGSEWLDETTEIETRVDQVEANWTWNFDDPGTGTPFINIWFPTVAQIETLLSAGTLGVRFDNDRSRTLIFDVAGLQPALETLAADCPGYKEFINAD